MFTNQLTFCLSSLLSNGKDNRAFSVSYNLGLHHSQCHSLIHRDFLISSHRTAIEMTMPIKSCHQTVTSTRDSPVKYMALEVANRHDKKFKDSHHREVSRCPIILGT